MFYILTCRACCFSFLSLVCRTRDGLDELAPCKSVVPILHQCNDSIISIGGSVLMDRVLVSIHSNNTQQLANAWNLICRTIDEHSTCHLQCVTDHRYIPKKACTSSIFHFLLLLDNLVRLEKSILFKMCKAMLLSSHCTAYCEIPVEMIGKCLRWSWNWQ